MRAYFLFAVCVKSCSEAFLLLPNPSNAPRRTHGIIVADTNADKPTQEWNVERYRDQHSFVWEYGSSLVDLLQAQPGERILDIGCGSGELAAAIAGTASNIEAVGFDSDASMVKKAQQQYPHLTFFRGDVRNFVVNDEPFDAIFSNAALHWVPPADVERSVISMSNALKLGGRFVVEFGGRGNVQQIVQAAQEVVPGVEPPWYFPSIAEYASLLEKHGIEVVSAMLFDRPTPLENGNEGLRNWIGCFGDAFFEGKSDEEVDLALDRIEEMLRPRLYDKQKNLWTADYRRIRMVGKRIS